MTITSIYAHCETAQETLDSRAPDAREVGALTTCQVLLDGLRVACPAEDLAARWRAVLHALEALHRADTVGLPESRVYRTVYRALSGRTTLED